MNKFYLVAIGLFMSFDAFAVNYKEGNEFIKIEKIVQNAPNVVEFFSFYCPYCYQFDCIYNVSQTIAKNLPRNIKIKRYHINFWGPLGVELTKAWAIATTLKVEDIVSPLLFQGIQKTGTINTPADIKNIFIKIGITNNEYNAALNNFATRLLIIKQQKMVENFHLYSAPVIFVNGKYMIRNNGILVKKVNHYGKAYSDIVKYLIDK